MDQNAVAVKIGFRDDLHRLRVDLNTFTLDALTQLFVRTFRLAPGAFVIKYTDAEGDTLNVCSDAEFVEACRVFLSGNHDELKALKFTAVAREGAAVDAVRVQFLGVSPHAKYQGIRLEDKDTLLRSRLTNQVIDRLEKEAVLLIKSPPMTGKSSLGTLVCRSLMERSQQKARPVIVVNYTTLGLDPTNETFNNHFKSLCGLSWLELQMKLEEGYTVYVVVDEAQLLYKGSEGSPRAESSAFWSYVKLLFTSPSLEMRLLLLASYGSTASNAELYTPYEIPEQMGIEYLNFDQDEIHEYVKKGFDGYPKLGEFKRKFCEELKKLTGGHVGLCVATIQALNGETRRHPHPTASEWLYMLSNRVIMSTQISLFDHLKTTRAVKVLWGLSDKALNSLERLLSESTTGADEDAINTCLREGVLVPVEDGREHLAPPKYEFASPVLWHFFFEKRFGKLERADTRPGDLPGFILCCLNTIDYEAIRKTLARSARSEIPLERAWQMEFYKAATMCTTLDFVISADAGKLLGSSGFIDFTVHEKHGSLLWGIELLRQGDRLQEHVDRFSSGGKYSVMQLTDYCVLDFRRVQSVDVLAQKLNDDRRLSDRVYFVCYDRDLSRAAVYTGDKKVNLRINRQ